MNILARIIWRIRCDVRRVVSRKRGIPPLIWNVREAALTCLDEDALHDIYKQITRIENDCVKGILIEAGCALGGSAIVVAAAKVKSRPFFVFDVFEMIPPPSERDGKDAHDRYDVIRAGKSKGVGGNEYYGYQDNLTDKVLNGFSRHGFPVTDNNVHLVKGLFQDTLHVQDEIAFAHIDGDWYESVMICLERIEPKLVSGGVIVVDDYDCWSGCRTAVDEYFSDKKEDYDFVKRSRLHIVKK